MTTDTATNQKKNGGPKTLGTPRGDKSYHLTRSCLSSFGHKLWLCSSYRSKRQLAPCSNSWQLQRLDRNSSPIWRWRKRSEQIFKIIIHKMSALITMFPDYPPTWGVSLCSQNNVWHTGILLASGDKVFRGREGVCQVVPDCPLSISTGRFSVYVGVRGRV